MPCDNLPREEMRSDVFLPARCELLHTYSAPFRRRLAVRIPSGTSVVMIYSAEGRKAMRQGHPQHHGHLEELRVEGERRHVTVLFADLVGFTAYSERAGEEAAYGLMQHLAKLLRNEIEVRGGSVRGFTGDGVMAL